MVFYQSITVNKKGQFEHFVLITYIQLSQKGLLLVRQAKDLNAPLVSMLESVLPSSTLINFNL